MPKTFYLIDGHSQIFRAYYAPFPALTAPSGEPVKATMLFTQMVLAILRDRRPDYLALTLDVEASTTERARRFPEYKQNREPPPEDLEPQVERILEIVGLLGIPVFRAPGYEADDVIASIAERLSGEDIELYVVSRDKDLHQIVGDRVKLWDPMKDEVLDGAAIERELGYRPSEAIEVQTLTGDAIDNVPGIPGIGPKKAAQLIRRYGTADAVVQHAAELTPKMRENVLAFAERIPLARKLVTLERNVPLDFDLEACRTKPVPVAKLRPLLEELRLRRLLQELEGLEEPAPEGEAPPAAGGGPAGGLTVTAPGRYALVDTREAFDEFLSKLRAAPRFAVDTETTSLRCVDCDLVGISFAWREGEAYYLPLRSRAGTTLPREEVLAKLSPILEDPAVGKCGQNLKFDLQSIRTEGIDLQGIDFDSMVASYLLRPGERGHDLDTLAREVVGHKKIATSELIGKGKDQISMLDVDTRRLADYAGEDADMAWRVCERLRPEIDASPMRSLYYDVELPLVRVLADMEFEGVRLDVPHLEALSRELEERIEKLRGAVYEAAGREFSIDSPKQLAEILFDEHKLRVVKRTKTARSTDAEVLETLAVETAHPLPKLVLEYRELSKLKNTYVDPLPQLISPRTGRLHASFHQVVAATGRLSSSDPNIQNIPVRSPEGREIRKAFVPRDRDHVLVSADYSQIELRILAHFSRDPALVEAFRSDRDIHAFVAAEIAGVPEDRVTREMRSRAKAVNFGIIYGQGPQGLARSLGIPLREAARFIALYKKRYPGIVEFMAQCVAQAEKTGKVATILGRRRAIPEVRSENRARRALGERLAINTVIQGSAADMIKVAMVRLHARLRDGSPPARLLVQVHDELVIEARRDRAEEVAELARREMAGAIPLAVPVRVDVAWGDNWLVAGGYA